jgi:hypothetical protein
VVEICEEEEPIAIARNLVYMIYDPGSVGTLRLDPGDLIIVAVGLAEQLVRARIEGVHVALFDSAKAPNQNAIDRLDTFRVGIRPGDIGARARGQNLDIMAALGQTLRDSATQALGPTNDLCSIALNHHRDSH